VAGSPLGDPAMAAAPDRRASTPDGARGPATGDERDRWRRRAGLGRVGDITARPGERPGSHSAGWEHGESCPGGRRARGDLALIGAVPALPGRAGRRVRGRSIRQGRTGRDATTPCRSARRLSSAGRSCGVARSGGERRRPSVAGPIGRAAHPGRPAQSL